jgi:chemotaxis protein CheD
MAKSDPQPAPQSYYDRDFDTMAVKILPGQLFASNEGTAITTLLGSCVSVCLYDEASGIGGMNHFMLPKLVQPGAPDDCSGACLRKESCCARYGNCAIRQLLQELERLGANYSRLQAKLFGAAKLMAAGMQVGEKNAEFAIEHLKRLGIPISASDLGGNHPRKVIFFPANGRAFVKRCRDLPAGN